MTLAKYAEYILLEKRLSILKGELPADADWPKVEFIPEEVEDIDTVIAALQSVRSAYGDE